LLNGNGDATVRTIATLTGVHNAQLKVLLECAHNHEPNRYKATPKGDKMNRIDIL
jgi:hypothetical protein